MSRNLERLVKNELTCACAVRKSPSYGEARACCHWQVLLTKPHRAAQTLAQLPVARCLRGGVWKSSPAFVGGRAFRLLLPRTSCSLRLFGVVSGSTSTMELVGSVSPDILFLLSHHETSQFAR